MQLLSLGFSHAEFRLPMIRADIVNYLGHAVETLSRLLHELEREGIIKVSG